MTDDELKEHKISERVTALEHDVHTIGETLDSHREETRHGFETIQKKSDENFSHVWRSQERLSSDIAAVLNKFQAGRQVNWSLLVAGAVLVTAVVGLVSAGMQQYIKASIDPIRDQQNREREYTRELMATRVEHAKEVQVLRDQLYKNQTAAMIAESLQNYQGIFSNGTK